MNDKRHRITTHPIKDKYRLYSIPDQLLIQLLTDNLIRKLYISFN